jgi:tRNA (pseudouridine54-N1)-methyltransferase
MREFIYYSAKARTSGNWKDLMSAGRMDIVCNVIIQAFFISNNTRDDVHLHLIFDGMPNPPMHLEFISNKDMSISKKDVGGLIKRMLYKCSEKKKTEIFPGCFIEKKSFSALLKELEAKGKKICVLDSKGENIRKAKLDDCVFVIGDHEGLPKKGLKKYKNKISVGNKIYFASQTFVIIHNELDLRGL